MKEFNVVYVLKDLEEFKDSIKDTVFAFINEQINDFTSEEKIKKVSTYEKKFYKKLIKDVKEIESTVNIELKNNDLYFSFRIQNSNKDFDEISEGGKRLWLRQHINDVFDLYLRNGLVEKTIWDEDDINKNMYIKIKKSFDETYIKSDLFWIDNESLSNKKSIKP